MVDTQQSPIDARALERVKALFAYLTEFSKLKRTVITRYKDHPQAIPLKKSFGENRFITLEPRGDAADTDGDGTLLRVKNPTHTPRPLMPKRLQDLLDEKAAADSAARAESSTSDGTKGSPLTTDPGAHWPLDFPEGSEGALVLAQWRETLHDWECLHREEQDADQLFKALHKIRQELERDTEPMELLVADYVVRDKDRSVEHPILVKPVVLTYDDRDGSMVLSDTDQPTRLQASLLADVEGLELTGLQDIEAEVGAPDFHPLDPSRARELVKRFITHATPYSQFIGAAEGSVGGENGAPIIDSRTILWAEAAPMIIFRRRQEGLSALARAIEESLVSLDQVPDHLLHLVGAKTQREVFSDEEPTLEQRLARANGQDRDIFLSKEANAEQLDIAREIGRHSAVVVQGPPGTGKTHTIANLMGHFLAEGKTVLVTSEKDKALAVLREKIDPALRSLCVSLVGHDPGGVRRSVDEIADRSTSGASQYNRDRIRSLAAEREEVLESLDHCRHQMMEALRREYTPLTVDGEPVMPMDAAKMVMEGQELLDRFPFEPGADEAFPFDQAMLQELYSLNHRLTDEVKAQGAQGIPDPAELMDAAEVQEHLDAVDHGRTQLERALGGSSVEAAYTPKGLLDGFLLDGRRFDLPKGSAEALRSFGDRASALAGTSPWQRALMVEGADPFAQDRWNLLFQGAETVNEYRLAHGTELLAHAVVIDYDALRALDLRGVLARLAEGFELTGMKKLVRGLGKKDEKAQEALALSAISLDGRPMANADDVALVLLQVELDTMQAKLVTIWNDLTASLGTADIPTLDSVRPEKTVEMLKNDINVHLTWYHRGLPALLDEARSLGLPVDRLRTQHAGGDIRAEIAAGLGLLSGPMATMALGAGWASTVRDHGRALNLYGEKLLSLGDRPLAPELLDAFKDRDLVAYGRAFAELQALHAKTDNLRIYGEHLAQVEEVCPAMARSIEAKEAPHDESVPPVDLEKAWALARVRAALALLDNEDVEELQREGAELGRRYRDLTAQLAAKMAWWFLSKRVAGDSSRQKALHDWARTSDKIGKGTGKNASYLRREANRLMAQCQHSVPAWIMNIDQAAAMFDPAETHFDVVIVDEASQSDISALTMTYLGDKVIIVGDEQQVSPMGIGQRHDTVASLQAQYLEGNVDSPHLFGLTDSLYAVAQSTFTHLMLKEHFRCLPSIIGYSNQLSYDGAIKPLREENDTDLGPSLVPFHVDGERLGKTNVEEARTIAGLIRGCIAQPEYADKTIGVISLLSGSQIGELQTQVERALTTRQIEQHRILVGDPANFQGDERDVIFLSMVDSPSDNGGPLNLRSKDNLDIKRRYNVAVSRAKDQLWLVHSLDPIRDLKQGDLRRDLLEYVIDPSAADRAFEKVVAQADSPFEEEVGRGLIDRGFRFEPQYPVGAYRIDMAAFGPQVKVAIECDGERWHSGEEKIREDLERQTILERLGWRFIRIRGSEFYRDKTATVDRVAKELEELGVPKAAVDSAAVENAMDPRKSDLMDRVVKAQEAYLAMDPQELQAEQRAAVQALALETKDPQTSTEEPLTVAQDFASKAEEVVNEAAETHARAALVETLKSVEKAKPTSERDWVLETVKAKGLDYVDKRPRGYLWVIGGIELGPSMIQLKRDGAIFIHRRGGSTSTGGRDAWFLRECTTSPKVPGTRAKKVEYQNTTTGSATSKTSAIATTSRSTRKSSRQVKKRSSPVNGPMPMGAPGGGSPVNADPWTPSDQPFFPDPGAREVPGGTVVDTGSQAIFKRELEWQREHRRPQGPSRDKSSEKVDDSPFVIQDRDRTLSTSMDAKARAEARARRGRLFDRDEQETSKARPVTDGFKPRSTNGAGQTPRRDWVVDALENHGLEYKDLRHEDGALWVLGGRSISDSMEIINGRGATFRYSANGGAATGHLPSWWMTGYPQKALVR